MSASRGFRRGQDARAERSEARCPQARVRVRGDLALDIGRNVVHGSDSVESAKRELAIYFGKDDVVEWTPAAAKSVTE